MKDQPVQSKSKKWVDYSDSDSSEQASHQNTQNDKPKQQHKHHQSKQPNKKTTYVPTKTETNIELDKLDGLNQRRVEEVWLEMYSQNIDYLEQQMNFLKKKAKKGGDIVSVFASKQKERYEIKVYINVAYDYIEKGYDAHDFIKVTVASKNFERNRNNRTPQLKQKQSFKEKGGDNANETQQLEKKKYIDKQTGKAAQVIKKPAEVADLERKYTKEESQRKGQMLGEFRNKQYKFEQKASNLEKKNSIVKEKQQANHSVPLQSQKVQITKKEEEKSVQPKKQKDAPKKQKKPKNKTKSLNPFEDMLDL